MAKMSIRVRNRNDNAAYVISSTDTHGTEVATSLAALDARLPPGEQLGTQEIQAFLDWLGRILGHANQQLADAESAYISEQSDDPMVRDERDQHLAALLACATQLRGRVSEVFGAATLPVYGMVEAPPRTPTALIGYARTAIALLREHPRRASDAVGSVFDTARAADAMTHAADKLAQSTARLNLEKRQLDAALVERNARMTDWERAYRGVAGSLANLYQLAGADELARRIRPTERRALGTVTVGADGDDIPDDTDADDTSPEPAADAPATDASADLDMDTSADSSTAPSAAG